MKSPVEVTTRADGPATVAHIAGEPDLTNVRDVEQQLWAGIPNTSVGVILDLSGVRYLDSAGLNLIFSLHRGLEKRGQRLCLAVPERALIRPLLQVVQIESAIRIRPTVEDALKEMARPEGVEPPT